MSAQRAREETQKKYKSEKSEKPVADVEASYCGLHFSTSPSFLFLYSYTFFPPPLLNTHTLSLRNTLFASLIFKRCPSLVHQSVIQSVHLNCKVYAVKRFHYNPWPAAENARPTINKACGMLIYQCFSSKAFKLHDFLY